MDYIWGTTTQEINELDIPNVNLDDYTPHHNLDDDSIKYFHTDEVDGIGCFVFDEDHYQKGLFEHGIFTHGEYRIKNIIYRGKFTCNTDDHDEYLNDENGEIEWVVSGIKFRGKVEDDKPVIGSGSYIIPENFELTYNEHTGVLTYENGRCIIRFSSGPISDVSSLGLIAVENFNTVLLNEPKTILYRDGCVFNGCEHDFSTQDIPIIPLETVEDTFTIPSTVTSISKWGWHQLNLWLLVCVCTPDLPVKFFDMLARYKITGSQIMLMTRKELKYMGLNCIQAIQLLDLCDNFQK